MRMLRLRAYYDPEQTAATHLDHDMCEAIASNDIFCVNYTPIPTRGVSKEIYEEYKKKKDKTECDYDNHIIVNRFYMFREGKNPVQRAIRYLACSIREYQLGTQVDNIDLVYSSSTPPTQGFLSALTAKKLSKRYGRKVPFVFNLQDIFPDSLVNAKLTKKGSLLWKIGRKIEDMTYRNADKIIVISESMKRNILEKGVPEEKIVVISNWVDLNKVRPVERYSNYLFDEFGIDRNKFIVVYAGNLGEAQGADIIIKVAVELNAKRDIQFVIFGGGSKYEEIKKLIDDNMLSNVIITGLQPQDKISEVYSMGDVALITCRAGTGNAGLPSKTWSIMACNTPIIASFDMESELANVIHDSGGGICVEPENVDALKNAIFKEYSVWKQGNLVIKNMREYALQNASKEICVQKYIDVFLSVVSN